DNAQAAEWTQSVDVDARVSLNGPGQQLIDVALALIVQAHAAHVSDLCFYGPWQFALDRKIPIPGRWYLEVRVLHGDREREVALRRACAARIINSSIADQLLRLKGSVAPQRKVTIDHSTVQEHSNAAAEGRLAVQCISNAQTRLERILVRFGKPIRQAVIQAIEFAAMQQRDAIAFRRRHLRAGQHDAVVKIPGGDSSGSRIHNSRLRWIKELRIEHRDVSPATVPRRPVRPAHSCFNSEVFSGFPAILKEQICGSRDPRHIALSAEFYVLIEIAHQRVSYGDACRLRMAAVTERKLAVLIDCSAGAGRSVNDEVILP